jgi:hypothetical protein
MTSWLVVTDVCTAAVSVPIRQSVCLETIATNTVGLDREQTAPGGDGDGFGAAGGTEFGKQ